MKRFIAKTLTCALIFSSQSALAFDTSLRGFIALDALNFEKVQGKKGAAVVGIGVLDLKVFATKDDLQAAIKLDLDGKLERENNIFEEAYVTYRGIPNWRLMLGKGVVRFQNLHWGAVVNSYQDGGTVIGTENGYRKVSRKAFIAASYGDRKMGFQNQFSIWGDSTEINTDDDGKPQYTESGGKITGYRTRDVTAFNTSKQIGLANKFDYFFTDSLKMNFSQLYYKNRLHTKPSYAVDIGLNYDTPGLEIWMDLLYGVTAKLPYESYTSFNKKDYFLQLGMEYSLNEKWSLVENVEALYVKDQQHTYDTSPTGKDSQNNKDKSGFYYESFTYKLESAVKYRLTSSSHITLGALYEKKTAKENGNKTGNFREVRNANKEAYKLLSAVSFWF